MSRDCGSGYEYSVFFTGWGPNSNNCMGNRDSLKFLNQQAQDLDCGSGSDYIVFFIPRLCYFLKVQLDLYCGSGGEHVVFSIPKTCCFVADPVPNIQSFLLAAALAAICVSVTRTV